MRITARFFVQSITRNAYDPQAGQVTLGVVSRGPENKQWAAATPSGRIELTINTSAAEWFHDRLGREVAVTFEDRPHVCPGCHQEIVAAASPYQNTGPNWRTGLDGTVEHITCPD